MEGLPRLTSRQMNALVGLSEVQKRKTGFTLRDLTIALDNASTSSTFTMLQRLEDLGLVVKNATDEDVPIKRFSYKTDVEVIEHEGTVGLLKMFA